MSFNEIQRAALDAPLDRARVKSRRQAGRDLSYIEGWWAISEANRIFGFDGWSRETTELRQLGEPREVKGMWRIAYLARVRIKVFAGEGSERVVRDGCGYGSGIDRDIGSAHESALKEAETDAMKRALMTFGNPFGLALYDKAQSNVADDEFNRQAGAAEVASPDETPEEVAAGLKGSIDGFTTDRAVTGFMLGEHVQSTLADLPEGLRGDVRKHAKARLKALGWKPPAKANGDGREARP